MACLFYEVQDTHINQSKTTLEIPRKAEKSLCWRFRDRKLESCMFSEKVPDGSSTGGCWTCPSQEHIEIYTYIERKYSWETMEEWTVSEQQKRERDQTRKAGKPQLSRSCGNTRQLQEPSRSKVLVSAIVYDPFHLAREGGSSIWRFDVCAGSQADTLPRAHFGSEQRKQAGSTGCHNTNLDPLPELLLPCRPAPRHHRHLSGSSRLSNQRRTHSRHMSLLHKVTFSRLDEIAILPNSYKQT